MNIATHWTLAEIAILRRLWPEKRRDELIAALPGRTYSAIVGRAKRLGVRAKANNEALYWLRSEDDALRRLYPSAPRSKLNAALPGRTKKSIYIRAKRLGLTRRAKPEALEAGKPDATWRIVPNRFVQVSDHGEVRSALTGKLLVIKFGPQWPTPWCRFFVKGVRQHAQVARLILEAFCPGAASDAVPVYIDGNKLNLTLENLRWSAMSNEPAEVPAPVLHAPAHSEVLAAVSAAVPRYHEPDVRADIIQDVVVACLTGEVHLNDLAKAIRKATTRHHAAAGTYKTISLDAEVFDGSKQTFVDRLADDVARF